ncbi:MAG: 2-amino-4-hydroxy-6-hydroxymethyldihydropteridine diphosphokinase [Puniceicoccales bacterium]|jgi:2-amino-4-hydroxy-6-hydroxymethyldihydropteridine diphosphokinase|nr:2-amino-4-hydroxy-6-hydroxymethyldihydropteridine diphosphokinase [Puniceicoccales bacterium]
MEASDLVRNFHVSFLSLGTNLGDKIGNLRRTLGLLPKNQAIDMIKLSSIYQTAPQNFTEQENFLNCVCEIKTTLDPIQLLHFCKSIERKLGRQTTFRYGPRLIDIDILLYDDLTLTTAELSIPHPELVRRNFALTPLNEIATDLIVCDKPLAHWMALCKDQQVALIGKLESLK